MNWWLLTYLLTGNSFRSCTSIYLFECMYDLQLDDLFGLVV